MSAKSLAVHSDFTKVAEVDETLGISMTALRDMLEECDFIGARKLCAAMHVRCEGLARIQLRELQREAEAKAGGAR